MMIEMLNVEGVVLEPAGALALTALDMLGREKLEGRPSSPSSPAAISTSSGCPTSRSAPCANAGLKKYFILRMPQRPGALKDFLTLLGEEDDIARFEYLKKSARNFGSVLIGIETKRPENFPRLLAAFDASDLQYEDITDNEILYNLVI